MYVADLSKEEIRMAIVEETKGMINAIDEQIEIVYREARRADCSPAMLRDANGAYLMTPLLGAKVMAYTLLENATR